MSFTFDDGRLGRVLDSVYDAAIETDGWPRALDELGTLFGSHFVDLFARTTDWSQYRGIAVGLDREDYENQFLGQWSNRNVWSQASPAQVTGEVKPTWQMVSKQDVLRSAIYNEYLGPRDLNEGLRLVLWSGEGWLQDISLLRPWAAGPFETGEIRTARMLLPHLQRAVATSRSLRGVDALAAFDTLDRPAFLLDWRGKVLRYNAACEPVLALQRGLAIRARHLEAGHAEDTVRLGAAIARAGCIGGTVPSASTLTIGPDGSAVTVLPVRDRAHQDLAGAAIGARAGGADAAAPPYHRAGIDGGLWHDACGGVDLMRPAGRAGTVGPGGDAGGEASIRSGRSWRG